MPTVNNSSHDMPDSYAGLDHDHLVLDTNLNAADNNVADSLESIEPLYDEGGLDHNELAEIHAYSISVDAQPESGVLEDLPDVGDNNSGFPVFPTNFQLRGVWGINLDEGDLAQRPDGGGPVEGNWFQSGSPGVIDGHTASIGMPGFNTGPVGDLGVYGTGSPGRQSVDGYDGWTCFPQDLGIRGPVLDENDDVGAYNRLIQEPAEDDTGFDVTQVYNGPLELRFRIDLLYNIHEVEGVRNDFDLPR